MNATTELGNVTSRELTGQIGRFTVKIIRQSAENCRNTDRWKADCDECEFGSYGFALSSLGDDEFVAIVIREICDRAAKLREFFAACDGVNQ